MSKGKVHDLLVVDDIHELPADKREKLFQFWCVICRQFRTGSAIASVEVGGWYCTWHHVPMTDSIGVG